MSDTKELIRGVMDTAIIPAFITVGGPTGFENVTSDCVSIPFLRLAQVNTPQAQPGTQKLAGLEAGMYFNPSTGRIYGKDPAFIILGFHRSWNIWNGEPPNARFVASVTNDDFETRYQSKTKNDNGKIVDAEGNRYQDTRNFFLLSATHPEDGVLLYPMTSTGIPASKKALAKSSAIKVKDATGRMVQVPMYSRVWELKVDFVQSPKGSYFKATDFVDKGWIPATIEGIVKAGFDEAQAYIKNKVPIVEAPGHDDEPDWVK
jgi:hypothetical protein